MAVDVSPLTNQPGSTRGRLLPVLFNPQVAESACEDLQREDPIQYVHETYYPSQARYSLAGYNLQPLEQDARENGRHLAIQLSHLIARH